MKELFVIFVIYFPIGLFCSLCRSFYMSCFYFLGNRIRKHTRDEKSLELHRESHKNEKEKDYEGL